MFSYQLPRTFTIIDHLLQAGGSNNFNTLTSGTGASASTAVTGELGHPGIIGMASGTTSTGRGRLATTTDGVRLGGGYWFVQGIVQIPTLSTVIEEFIAYFGFYDGTTSDGTDGAYFKYDRAANGDVWSTKTINNSVATENVLSNAVTAGTWVRLGIEVNQDSTRVNFYLDGALVQTHTTNIPTGSVRTTLVAVAGRKTAGTTSVNMIYIDHIIIHHQLNNPMWSN